MSASNSGGRETLVVELTPPGRGAVAVVLVSGADALRIVAECFTLVSGRALANLPIGRIVLGRWGDVAAATEELVLCRRSESQIEIHCHGGVAAVNAALERLMARGCRQVTWHDWLRTTGLDPIQADAQIAIADAATIRTAAILLDQYHGALAGAIRAVIDRLSAGDRRGAANRIEDVLAYRGLGMHLTTPWNVVLAGRPNVGKSSLINALAGFQRSIVSPIPGTTRDIVTMQTAIDGWPVRLADTAGLRAAGDDLESAGVDLALATLAKADLVVAVDDATVPTPLGSDIAASLWSRFHRVIHVRNKIDLVSTVDRLSSACDAPVAGGGAIQPIPTSAATGAGIAELLETISRSLVPIAPPAGSAVPFMSAHLASLEAARAAIDKGDTRSALAALQPLLAAARC
jgi:tRNA modification GTPase